jgi:multiple sugar transport system substrate-binding protein
LTRRRLLRHAGVGLALAACAPGQPAAPERSGLGPASLDVIVRDDPVEQPLLEGLFATFKQQYPQVAVNSVSPGSNFNDKVAALLAAGTPPALTGPWGTGGYRVWAIKNVLVELDPPIARDKFDLTDFYPRFVEFTKINGKRYALPMGIGVAVLVFNKESFQKAGQAPLPDWKDKSWTWEKFTAVTRQLTRGADGPDAVWGTGNPWADDRRLAYVYGGAWFDLKAYETGKATTFLYEPNAVIEGIQYMADLINKYRVRPTSADLSRVAGNVDGFIAGRLAINGIGTSSYVRYSKEVAQPWGVAAVPNPPALPRRNWITPDPWFGFKLPKGGDEQWALMKFITSRESMKVFPLQATFLPPRQSLATDYRDFMLKLGKLTAEDVQRTLDAIAPGVVPTSHAVPLFTDAWPQVLLPELNRVLAGEITAKEMIERVRPAMEQRIKEQP